MSSVDELKSKYGSLDRDQKLAFLDGLVTILQRHEDAESQVFDHSSTANRIALLKDSAELQQLIFAVKDQKKVTRKSPGGDAQELWLEIQKFFDGEAR